jgi:hypothetical protein
VPQSRGVVTYREFCEWLSAEAEERQYRIDGLPFAVRGTAPVTLTRSLVPAGREQLYFELTRTPGEGTSMSPVTISWSPGAVPPERLEHVILSHRTADHFARAIRERRPQFAFFEP